MSTIEEEIRDIRYQLSVSIPEELKTALEYGDLNDNSELSDVLNRQYFLNVRLNQLLSRVHKPEIIDFSKLPTDRVHLGSKVTVKNLSSGEILKFLIVNTVEQMQFANDNEFVDVTIKSPIGKSILNKAVNEEFIVKLPSETAKFVILKLFTIHDHLTF
jgi:transcription elongation factor GreA